MEGVLTIYIEIEEEETGQERSYTWVLNKQAPNKQIWLSSPLSGPMRFEYSRNKALSESQRGEPESAVWCSTRTGQELTQLLYDEIEMITKVDLTD